MKEKVEYQEGFVCRSVGQGQGCYSNAKSSADQGYTVMPCDSNARCMCSRCSSRLDSTKEGRGGVEATEEVFLMRLDKEPVRFGAMGIGTRRSGRTAKKERNRKGIKRVYKRKIL